MSDKPRTIASFSHHHDSDKHPWRAFVDNEADALRAALVEDLGLGDEAPSLEIVQEILVQAKKAGPGGYTFEIPKWGHYVVWDYREDERQTHRYRTSSRNFGVGCGNGIEDTEKRENCWIALEAWTPDPKRVEELAAKSHQELVQMILESEAKR